MRMSVGIGPFRFYSGPSRRRRRVSTNSSNGSWWPLIIGGVTGFGFVVVLFILPWSAIAVGTVVLVVLAVHLVRWMRRRSPTALRAEEDALARAATIGEEMAREHPAAAIRDKCYLHARTINNVMIAAMYIAKENKLSKGQRRVMNRAAYDEAKRRSYPQR
jgi:heme exporter protein D